MRIAVIADTHLRDGLGRMPPAALDQIRSCAAVLHAGDVVSRATLEAFARLAPLHAVRGNNDVELADVLPDTLVVELDGVRIGMVHDSGPARGRAGRLQEAFPGVDVVVFGHSHIPWRERTPAGTLLFNPGSPTQRRRQPERTMGVLDLADGAVREASLIPLGRPG